MQRRGFLKALLAMPAVAMAAKLGVDKSMADEIRVDLERDLARPDRLYFQMPGTESIMLPEGKVWASTAGMKPVFEKLVADEMAKLRDQFTHDQGCYWADRMAKKMVEHLDFDLRTAKVPASTMLIVGKPLVRVTPSRKVELVSGIEAKAGIFGTEYEVGYVRPQGSVGIITDLG